MSRHVDLAICKAEIESLGEAVQKDFDAEVWLNWPHYVEEFNRLLQEMTGGGIVHRVQAILPVPREQLPYLGGLGVDHLLKRQNLGKLQMVVNDWNGISMIRQPILPTIVPFNRFCGFVLDFTQ